MVRRLRFSGPKTSIICSPMTSLKTSIKTITYLSDTGCLEIQGASLVGRCISLRGDSQSASQC
ncbi:nitrite extrusion protein 2 [Escherichia coli]|nr:nitrite extrusion protein 2 [Escherichia coli]OKT26458.1 nitrite extrusion protein 2 [Escherichia coli]